MKRSRKNLNNSVRVESYLYVPTGVKSVGNILRRNIVADGVNQDRKRNTLTQK